MKRSEILSTATQYTTSDRNSQYGEPEDSFGRIAEYWSVYLNRDLTPVDVSVMMALFKVARIEANPGKADSWIDLVGYGACGGEIATTDDEPTATSQQLVSNPDLTPPGNGWAPAATVTDDGWIAVGPGTPAIFYITYGEKWEFENTDGDTSTYLGSRSVSLVNIIRYRRVFNEGVKHNRKPAPPVVI